MAIGLGLSFLGVLILTPPQYSILWGIILLVGGVSLTFIGRRIAQNQPQRREQIEKETLRYLKEARNRKSTKK